MHFDYTKWNNAPSKGIRGGNNRFLLGALFYDQEWRDDLAQYVLGAEEYQTPAGRWLPSAYQVVVYAVDEYDAMKRLVGSLEQWDRLKELEWFNTWLDRALREQQAMQRSIIRTALLTAAMVGENQAARTLMAMDKEEGKVAKKVGRPKSDKPSPKAPAKKENSGDAARVLSFKK